MIRLIIGITLMGIAFVALFMFIGGPENKLVANIMTSLTCKAGETFTEVDGGYVYTSDGGGQTFNYYCRDEAGNQRDVTGEGVLIGIIGFVVPLVIGLVLTIVGPIGMVRGRTRKARVMSTNIGFGSTASTQTDPFGQPININDFQAGVSGQQVKSGTVVTMNGQPANFADLPPETAQLVQQMLGSMNSMLDTNNFVNIGGDLTDKLQQLQEARDKNLITQEEYDKLRKAILDQMS